MRLPGSGGPGETVLRTLTLRKEIGLRAWAAKPPMPLCPNHTVTNFGKPTKTSHISNMVLSIVKFGGEMGMVRLRDALDRVPYHRRSQDRRHPLGAIPNLAVCAFSDSVASYPGNSTIDIHPGLFPNGIVPTRVNSPESGLTLKVAIWPDSWPAE